MKKQNVGLQNIHDKIIYIAKFRLSGLKGIKGFTWGIR